jgi:hypothetical protein
MSQYQPDFTPETLAEIELNRRRFLASGRIFGGIPTSVDHQNMLMQGSTGTQLNSSSSFAHPGTSQVRSIPPR